MTNQEILRKIRELRAIRPLLQYDPATDEYILDGGATRISATMLATKLADERQDDKP